MLSASFTNRVRNTQPHFQRRKGRLLRTPSSRSRGDADGNCKDVMETLSSEGCRKSMVLPGCVRAGGGQDPASPSITCSVALPCSGPGGGGWELGGSFSLPVLAGLCSTRVSPASWRRENPFTRGSCSSKIRLWSSIAPGVSLQSAAKHAARAGGQPQVWPRWDKR